MGYDLTIPDLDSAAASFHVAMPVMPILRHEMRHYGMIDETAPAESEEAHGIPAAALCANDGQHVSAQAIAAALRHYDAAPKRDSPAPYEMTPDDPEHHLLHLALDFAGGDVFGYQLVANADTDGPGLRPATPAEEHAVLREKWYAWIAYLRLAAELGGFRVD